MTVRSVKFVLSILAVMCFLLPAAAMAEDAPPPLAEVWMVTPKSGHGEEFRKAIKEHMAFRSENGDSREWQAYTPVLGDELNRIAIRFCCFSWADHDAYQEEMAGADKIRTHFAKHVTPHVEKWTHYFDQMNWSHSNWVEGKEPYKYYAVTEFDITPAHAAEFKAARDKLIQIGINQGWATDERPWLWTTRIGGTPQQSVVIPHVNYASFDRDQDAFFRFLSEHMGNDKAVALLEEFSSATKKSYFQIWEHETSLSMSRD